MPRGLDVCAQRNPLGSFRCGSDVNLRLDTGGRVVGRSDAALELGRVGSVDEVDRATAKAPAGHTRPKYSFLLVSELHHEIHLGAAYLVVVAHAPM